MNKTILAIGAHIGDMELTAGALLASCAVSGGHAVTLALTAGEKGAPAGADVAAYRQEKIAQAQAFMRLGDFFLPVGKNRPGAGLYARSGRRGHRAGSPRRSFAQQRRRAL